MRWSCISAFCPDKSKMFFHAPVCDFISLDPYHNELQTRDSCSQGTDIADTGSSALWNTLNCACTLTFSCHIFSGTLSFQTRVICILLKWRDHILHPHKTCRIIVFCIWASTFFKVYGMITFFKLNKDISRIYCSSDFFLNFIRLLVLFPDIWILKHCKIYVKGGHNVAPAQRCCNSHKIPS